MTDTIERPTTANFDDFLRKPNGPSRVIKPKRLLCLGLSHHTAPVYIREQLCYTVSALDGTLAQVRRDARFSEFTILSTCNRVEFYSCVPPDAGTDGFCEVLDLVAETKDCSAVDLAPYLYRYEGLAVVRHLCRVAAGLDSMVLGESQILGQVSKALGAAAAHQLDSPMMTAVFQTAIKAGKRARAETGINHNSVSVSSVAVQLAQRVVGDLTSVHAAVIGVGEMGRLVIKALKSRNLRRLTIVNRSYPKATRLAEQIGAEAAPLEELSHVLAESDLVISASRAKHLMIDADRVRAAMRARADRPLIVIDIALPRNVEPSVAALPNVRLFDMDQLQAQVVASLEEREREIPLVEAIISEEVERFSKWLREAMVEPLISDLRRKAEAIRQQEMERAVNTLPPLREQEIEQLQLFSRSLVNKLLHDPTVRLRQEAVHGEAAQYLDLVRNLFAL